MQPAQVTQLQSHILRGEWGEALQLLAMLVSSGELLREAKFLVRACTCGCGCAYAWGEQICRKCTA